MVKVAGHQKLHRQLLYLRFHQSACPSAPEPTMQTIQFELAKEHIALCDLLKLAGVADSGGRGKMMVAEGLVKVDGKTESRKTAKIRAGQSVECMGVKIEIMARES